jgi:serine/threonine protein kinase
MGYMPGGSLADRIAQHLLPFEDVVQIITQPVPALNHVYSAGIIRRDPKPAGG